MISYVGRKRLRCLLLHFLDVNVPPTFSKFLDNFSCHPDSCQSQTSPEPSSGAHSIRSRSPWRKFLFTSCFYLVHKLMDITVSVNPSWNRPSCCHSIMGYYRMPWLRQVQLTPPIGRNKAISIANCLRIFLQIDKKNSQFSFTIVYLF